MKARQSVPYTLEVGYAEGCVVKYLIELSGRFKTGTVDLLASIQKDFQALSSPEYRNCSAPKCFYLHVHNVISPLWCSSKLIYVST